MTAELMGDPNPDHVRTELREDEPEGGAGRLPVRLRALKAVVRGRRPAERRGLGVAEDRARVRLKPVGGVKMDRDAPPFHDCASAPRRAHGQTTLPEGAGKEILQRACAECPRTTSSGTRITRAEPLAVPIAPDTTGNVAIGRRDSGRTRAGRKGSVSARGGHSVYLESISSGHHLSAVQNTQNSNPIGGHDIGGDERGMGNDKLARPRDPARPTAFGKFKEPPHSGDNPGLDRRARTVRFEVFEDRVRVGQRALCPDQPQPHG